jgi:hypothetical protein
MNYCINSKPPIPSNQSTIFNPFNSYSNLGIAFTTNSRQLGINFENQVHNTILTCLNVTNILREKDIIKHYGQTCTAIDHMFGDLNTNTRFCIQSKWKNSKEPLDYVHHFIKCVETVQKTSNYKVQGIMLSKQPITARSEAAFKAENLSNPNIKFINIHLEANNFNLEQTEAQIQLIDRLLDYLHRVYSIWTYDIDGAVIMR